MTTLKVAPFVLAVGWVIGQAAIWVADTLAAIMMALGVM